MLYLTLIYNYNFIIFCFHMYVCICTSTETQYKFKQKQTTTMYFHNECKSLKITLTGNMHQKHLQTRLLLIVFVTCLTWIHHKIRTPISKNVLVVFMFSRTQCSEILYRLVLLDSYTEKKGNWQGFNLFLLVPWFN